MEGTISDKHVGTWAKAIPRCRSHRRVRNVEPHGAGLQLCACYLKHISMEKGRTRLKFTPAWTLENFV